MDSTIETLAPENLDAVMDIWLAGNIDAHPFIEADTWKSLQGECRRLIAQADVRVWKTESAICGFIGITPPDEGKGGGYVAGLFVDAAHRSQGIGRALLDRAKADYARLSLHVFAENPRALAFYEREGFARSRRTPSGMFPAHEEWLMEWSRA